MATRKKQSKAEKTHDRLAPGKFLGLSRIARDGFFRILAIDHRDSIKKLISPSDPAKAKFVEIFSKKQEILSILSPEANAFILDPETILFPTIYSRLLSDKGVLTSIEKTGYFENKAGRNTVLLKNWGVRKIKRAGADGVKLFVFYSPEYKRASRRAENLIRGLSKECRKEDILFLVEPLPYSLSEKKNSPEFAKKKPELIIRTAERFSKLGIDILKTDFPCDLNYEHDLEKALGHAKALDEATSVPWILLSQGAHFNIFRKQIYLASKAGASGYAVGRAVWQEAFSSSDFSGFLRNESLKRMREINNIVSANAKPVWETVFHERNSAFSDKYYQKY